MTKRTSVGIVGAGAIAATAHIPVLRAMPDAGIAWIADTNERRGREVARLNHARFAPVQTDLDSLPPCDVVLLAIPVPPRGAYFDYFAGTNTAILAEKPLANDAPGHARLTARFASWRLAVGYQRRYYATSLLLRSLVRSAVFGPLLGIRIAEGGRVMRTGGLGTYQDVATAEGGGVVKNLGCHSLDLALWLTDAGGFRIHDRQVEWDGDTDRRVHAVIELIDVGGSVGHRCRLDWTLSWLDAQPNCYEFEFNKALLRCPIAPADHIDLLGKDRRMLTRLQTPAGQGATTSAQAFYLEWDDLLAGLKSRREPVVSAISCLKAAELMDELLLR